NGSKLRSACFHPSESWSRLFSDNLTRLILVRLRGRRRKGYTVSTVASCISLKIPYLERTGMGVGSGPGWAIRSLLTVYTTLSSLSHLGLGRSQIARWKSD